MKQTLLIWNLNITNQDYQEQLLLHDDENYVQFSDLYNYSKNKVQSAYLYDKNKAKYAINVTRTSKKVSVKSTASNNILFSLNSGAESVATSKYNDIIYSYGGNDTFTYTGGKDYYFANGDISKHKEGNNTYYAKTFNASSFLSISDCADGYSQSKSDVLKVNCSYKYLKFFYDKKDLYVFYDKNNSISLTKIKSALNNEAKGVIKVNNYSGYGKIEKITASNKTLTSTVSKIVQNVQSWMSKQNTYSSVIDVLNSSDTTSIKAVLACCNMKDVAV